MTKYREIIRMSDKQYSQHQIAAALNCSRNTVRRVVQQAQEKKLNWKEIQSRELTEDEISCLFFPPEEKEPACYMPNMEYLDQEMKKVGVTLTTLWGEYCENCRASGKRPLMYSQFCYYYRQHLQKSRASMHIPRKPAEQIEVDWAGKPAYLKDELIGDAIPAYIFIAVLSYSQYTYAEAFLCKDLDAWIRANVHMLEFFGGAPKLITPDNLKTGVNQSDWYTPDIQKNYQEFAEHYDTVILPARVRHPKDKPNAEGAVDKFSNNLLGKIRNRTFFTLSSLNDTIFEHIRVYNSHPFQKKDGSRASLFAEEKVFLTPLPKTPYELAHWSQATVQFNYHISVDGILYSVPYQYLKQVVDVKSTDQFIEVYLGSKRICSHKRLYGRKGQYVTEVNHMPTEHQNYLEWDERRFLSWAQQIGPNTYRVVQGILQSFKIPQQGFRSCMGLLKKAEKYSERELEECCTEALKYSERPSYKTVARIFARRAEKPIDRTSVESAVDGDRAHAFLRHTRGNRNE